MKPIKTAEFIKSSARVDDCPNAPFPEYAFIGRSNVGKSSLINFITNHGKLAKVSSKPGKTQLINHFVIDESWYLVDLPGYGWAKVSKSMQADWKKMIADYLRKRAQLTLVFVLIDARHEPQKIDLDFIHSLGKAGIPLGMIFTKIDKLGMNKSQSNVALFHRELRKDWEELPPHFLTSTVTGQGKDEVIGYIRGINSDFQN